MNATTQTEERRCSRKKHRSTFTAKGDGSFYKNCDGCRAYNRAYSDSEKVKVRLTEPLECQCGSTVQRNHWARHLKTKQHYRWDNAKKNFKKVLDELISTHKQEIPTEIPTETAIDYDDRCGGCGRHNDFCRCVGFF